MIKEKQVLLTLPGYSPENENRPSYLGHDFFMSFLGEDGQVAVLKKEHIVVKTVDLTDKLAKKIFIVDTVNMGVKRTLLAKALNISRQTVHNYMESYKHFGAEGLVGGYNVSKSSDIEEHRKEAQGCSIKGNKAVLVAQIRKEENLEKARKAPKQLFFDLNDEPEIPKEECPYNEIHDWEFTRYAGVFPYLIVLIFNHNWLGSIIKTFGTAYKIFPIFLFMTVFNVKSIEQLKNIVLKEAGLVLGLKGLTSKKRVWQWFYLAANLKQADNICRQFFKHQILKGFVGVWRWFMDGHFLPYTGKEKVHSGYSTQRRMPMPGQTSMVTSDHRGRIVDFQIQEGKGNFREEILNLKKRWTDEVPDSPVIVFDREGYGAEFFCSLIENKISFVTWEKHINSSELNAISDENFSPEFEFNDKKYSVFEGEKNFSFKKEKNVHKFTLRRIYIWNKTSKRKTCCLAWESERTMSDIECAQSILSRWGASENAFKHIQDRHPFHYHPGFKKVKSDNQLLANPQIKELEKQLKSLKKELVKKYKKISKSKQADNNDGTHRKNSAWLRLEKEINQLEAQYASLVEKKKNLPAKIDVSTLEDYRSFQKIDNEGKKLFDFVTASAWNARKDMTDWLLAYYPNKNEYVDLFYAITNCHGWIKSEEHRVLVRLEPLQQEGRRKAQEQLCKKLNSLAAKISPNKILQLEVGTSPLK